jgi:hypothetical protein
MSPIARLALRAGALFGLWLLLVGTTAGLEQIAGACAVLVAVTVHWAVMRTRTRRVDISLRDSAQFLTLPWAVVRGLGLVLLALVRRRQGAFRTVPAAAAGDDPAAAGRRAVQTLVNSFAPNTYVVAVDRERRVVLVHELDGRRTTRAS